MNNSQFPPFVAVIWGEEGTWKTTMALSFPKNILHIETDVGGFQRASWRVDTKGIVSESFMPPLPVDISAKQVTVRFPKKQVGQKELFQNIFVAYYKALQDKNIKTVVIDSATELWGICHRAYLQQLQEDQLKQGKKEHDIRESLIPIEYGDPNARMRQIINAAKSAGRNLVLIHYPKDVYVNVQRGDRLESVKSGETDIDGFKETGRLADVIIETKYDKKQKKILAKIGKKCALPGIGSDAIDMELPEVSYSGLLQLKSLLSDEGGEDV